MQANCRRRFGSLCVSFAGRYPQIVGPRTAASFALWLAAASCGYYDSSLLNPTPAQTGDSGTGAQSGGGGAAVCEHAEPPGPPAVKDAGGDLDLVFAMRTISFGFDSDGGALALGYDIDKTCTNQGEKDSCLEPAWASGDHTDGPQGRDNSGGALIREFAQWAPGFGEPAWNDALQSGGWSVIVRLKHYNGLPDDDQVELTWYVADNFSTFHKLADGGGAAPKWDGTDTWPITSVCLDPQPAADGGVTYDLDHGRYVDSKAYVSGGKVVGMMAQGQIQADLGIKLVLTDVYLTARVNQTPSGWELRDGNISGVWTLDDIFEQLGYFTFQGIPMCMGNPIYAGVKQMVCKYADIYRSRGTPTTPCDSLSVAIGFESLPASISGVVVPSAGSKACDAAHDPVNDSCDK